MFSKQGELDLARVLKALIDAGDIEPRPGFRGAGLVDHGSRVRFDKGGSAQILEYLESLNLPEGTQIDIDDVMKYAKENNISITQDNISRNINNTNRKITSGKYEGSYELKDASRNRWNAIKHKVKTKQIIFDPKNPGPVFEQLDTILANKKKFPTQKSVLIELGYSVPAEGPSSGKLKPILEAYAKNRKITIPEGRFPIGSYEGTPLWKNLTADYKAQLVDGKPNISTLAKKYFPNKAKNDARMQVNDILKKANLRDPSEWENPSKGVLNQSKTNAYNNIIAAKKKAGVATSSQTDKLIRKVLDQNEIYQNMSIEDIAKDKKLLESLRLRIDADTGEVFFDGYTKSDPNWKKKGILNDFELAEHAKNRANKYTLIAPDHISPKSLKKQNVWYPNNIQPTTYMENSQLNNARTYLQNNPDGNWKSIDNYLDSRNLTIRGKEFTQTYGYKEPIVYNSKTGTSNIVDAGLGRVSKVSRPPMLGSNLANVTADMFDFRKLPGDVRHFADIAARYGAKSPALLSALKKAKGAGKWTGIALAAEPAFAAPFAEYEYKMGESPERMLGTATWGLLGETEEEELRKAVGERGYATQQIENYGSTLNALKENYRTLNDQNDPRGEKRQRILNLYNNTRGKYNIAYNMFVDDQGQFDKGAYNQALNNYTAGVVQIDKFKKQLAGEREQKRIETAERYILPEGYDPQDPLTDDVIRNIKGYAGGGLTRTVAPDSGPVSRGLSYLYNRVRRK